MQGRISRRTMIAAATGALAAYKIRLILATNPDWNDLYDQLV
jgi:hypothetical protein